MKYDCMQGPVMSSQGFHNNQNVQIMRRLLYEMVGAQ
jgi:hypothetical protein